MAYSYQNMTNQNHQNNFQHNNMHPSTINSIMTQIIPQLPYNSNGYTVVIPTNQFITQDKQQLIQNPHQHNHTCNHNAQNHYNVNQNKNNYQQQHQIDFQIGENQHKNRIFSEMETQTITEIMPDTKGKKKQKSNIQNEDHIKTNKPNYKFPQSVNPSKHPDFNKNNQNLELNKLQNCACKYHTLNQCHQQLHNNLNDKTIGALKSEYNTIKFSLERYNEEQIQQMKTLEKHIIQFQNCQKIKLGNKWIEQTYKGKQLAKENAWKVADKLQQYHVRSQNFNYLSDPVAAFKEEEPKTFKSIQQFLDEAGKTVDYLKDIRTNSLSAYKTQAQIDRERQIEREKEQALKQQEELLKNKKTAEQQAKVEKPVEAGGEKIPDNKSVKSGNVELKPAFDTKSVQSKQKSIKDQTVVK